MAGELGELDVDNPLDLPSFGRLDDLVVACMVNCVGPSPHPTVEGCDTPWVQVSQGMRCQSQPPAQFRSSRPIIPVTTTTFATVHSLYRLSAVGVCLQQPSELTVSVVCSGCLSAVGVCLQWVSVCSGCLSAVGVCLQRVSVCSGCLSAVGVCLQWVSVCSGCLQWVSAVGSSRLNSPTKEDARARGDRFL
jgi:hypothetical protein